ncbi:MAG: hypothetical protein HY775_06740 [Acidobacteria bacterium]|nr:hypothetical protein [Acidobacteriota bacterium]
MPVSPEVQRAEAFRRWLAGHRAAQEIMEGERRRWLRAISQPEATGLYLARVSMPGGGRKEAGHSPVLVAMRRALARHGETRPG